MVLVADADADGLEANAVHQAIDGINRTVGKELRGGATSNLVHVPSDLDPADLASTLAFLLEGRSAFVDGQAWTVGAPHPSLASRSRKAALAPEIPGASATFRERRSRDGGQAEAATPLAGRVVVVTGAARGIGAQIATVAARDGATVVCVDVPAAGEALAALANQLAGLGAPARHHQPGRR